MKKVIINIELNEEDIEILKKYDCFDYEKHIKEVAERQCKELAQSLREAEFMKK